MVHRHISRFITPAPLPGSVSLAVATCFHLLLLLPPYILHQRPAGPLARYCSLPHGLRTALFAHPQALASLGLALDPQQPLPLLARSGSAFPTVRKPIAMWHPLIGFFLPSLHLRLSSLSLSCLQLRAPQPRRAAARPPSDSFSTHLDGTSSFTLSNGQVRARHQDHAHPGQWPRQGASRRRRVHDLYAEPL